MNWKVVPIFGCTAIMHLTACCYAWRHKERIYKSKLNRWFTQNFGAKICGLSADLVFIKAQKLLVAIIFEIQGYLDAGSWTLITTFTRFILNLRLCYIISIQVFNQLLSFCDLTMSRSTRQTIHYHCPKAFSELFLKVGTIVLITQHLDPA